MPSHHSKHSPKAKLPDSLRSQLVQFRGQLWRIKIMEAFWAGCFGILFSFIILFTLDRFIATSELVRLVLLLAGTSVFAIFGPLWINRWVFRHRSENQIAQLIAKQYPRLGDRLLGVVELQNQDSSSPRLKEAAMAQVAADFSKRDLTDALPITWHKKWATAVCTAVGIAIAAFIITPKASWNALQRWIMPLADIERYTQTKIDLSQLPSPYYVAQGESYTLPLSLTEDSNTPNQAKARVDSSPWQKVDASGRNFAFEFPKAFKPQKVEIRVGDALHFVDVLPITRPSLSRLSAQIAYPHYLQKKPERIDLSSGQLSAVEGSTLLVQGQANSRNLASVHAQVELEKEWLLDLSAQINGANFQLSPITVEHPFIRVPLSWTDEHGLASATETQLGIERTLDLAPSAYIENTADTHYLLADDSLSFEIFAEDDFGIKRSGFAWSGSFTKPSPHKAAKGSLDVTQGNPDLKQVKENVDFSFSAYDICPQKLQIQAWVEDYKTDRERIYSSPITVYVLTPAEHRERIQQRTKSATNKLEELMRTELQLLDENKRLERIDGAQLQTPEKRAELAEQARKERENAEAMQKLSAKMQDIFEDASKNKAIESSALKKLAQSALQMKQMSSKAMPDIADKLDSAQSRENTEQKAQEEVKEAVEAQQKLLKKMEETIANNAEANKQLEAGTFVNRLNKAAENQELLSLSLVNMMRKLHQQNQNQSFVINEFENIDPQEQRAILELYTQQKQTGEDLRWIEEDLSHFYLRTQQAEHKDVLDKIKSSTIHKDMEDMLYQLERSENNLTAIRANKASKQLRQWAQDLAAAIQKSQNAANGGGGGQPSGGDALDFEFMLRVMRLIQQETSIRSSIRSLEQKRRFLNNSEPPAPSLL